MDRRHPPLARPGLGLGLRRGEERHADDRRGGAVAEVVVGFVPGPHGLVLVGEEEHPERAQGADEDVAHRRVVVRADRARDPVVAEDDGTDGDDERQGDGDEAHQPLQEQVGAGERAVAGRVHRLPELLRLRRRVGLVHGLVERGAALLLEPRLLGFHLLVALPHVDRHATLPSRPDPTWQSYDPP
jgi:hypothetical protein